MHKGLGSVAFRLEGLSLEKLLNLCLEQGIRLENVNRPTVRSLTATVTSGDYPAIQAIAEKRGWKLTMQRETGLPAVRRFVWRRGALVAGILLFCALAWGLSACVWQIRIVDAGAYVGEVRTVLKEQEIYRGRLGFTIDIEQLRGALEQRLTGLAWVSVQLDGVRLTVRCVQGDGAGSLMQGGTPGDVVAEADGVIESIRVIAGTAAVKPGDVVQAGQVLIYGHERAWQDAVTPVRARGEVLARVWYSASAMVPATETRTVPVGEAVERMVLCTPWFEWSATQAPEDAQAMECSERLLVMGGVFPVWMRLEQYQPILFEEHVREEAALKAEAELAAMRIATEKAGLWNEIVDKWVDYSMIDDEVMCARVILETQRDIALPPEED